MMIKINLILERKFKEVDVVNKKQVIITLGIMCIILTMAIAVQIRTTDNASTTAKQTLNDNGLRDEVLKWKEKYDNASENLKKSEKKLEDVRQKATQNDEASSSKEEELHVNNTLLGETDVSGEGIIIEIQDVKAEKTDKLLSVEDLLRKLIHDGDLLSIVNELKNADAEAIEINGQRIVNTSSITCEGNVIKVNDEKIGSPVTIKAIGSQALLYGQITRPGSSIYAMEEDMLTVNVTKADKINIKKYSEITNFEHLKEVK